MNAEGKSRNWTKAHLKSETRNLLKLDGPKAGRQQFSGVCILEVQFEISDFGFEVGFRPISRCLPPFGSGLIEYIIVLCEEGNAPPRKVFHTFGWATRPKTPD